LRSAWPRASVIVVTIDNLAFTKLCLASLLANTEYPNLEIVVVDNGSADGTPSFCARWRLVMSGCARS
jgi:GT2 family glycosyltransferase